MFNIVNLTPHDVTWDRVSIPPSGMVARAVFTDVERVIDVCFDMGGGTKLARRAAVVEMRYDRTDGLPDPIEGTLFIVSGMVLTAHPERTDLLTPDSSGKSAMRDSKHVLRGVRRMATKRVFPQPLHHCTKECNHY